MSKIYFIWNNTLHVSDGLSVHHQELKTVHAAKYKCQTDTAVCLLASRQQSSAPDDGRKDRPKHVQCYSK